MKRPFAWWAGYALLPLLLAAPVPADDAASVTIVRTPPTDQTNPHYVGNREPLTPAALIKLPIGAIEPHGWLRTQLERLAAGFFGHLPELSRFLQREGNAWLDPQAEGDHGWEEVPYWLRGYGDLGYVLGDERIIAEARSWIESALATQRDDGYFGPRSNLTRIAGTPDLWPNMVMVNALQSYHEFTGDPRVLDLLRAYFRWQLELPEADFLRPYWQHQRGGDNLASILWLYNRIGDAWLLDLADKTHRRTADWAGGIANWHGVNICQGFREPGNYYVRSRDPRHLSAVERNYQQVMREYGQVPGGMFGADEICRPGYTGPRQAAETCSMVELMLSCESLLEISGLVRWADRCEDVAFNSLPASMTADLKALRYLTAPNQPLADHANKAPGIANRGPMFAMNPHRYRCCQHNVGHGWPYFAEHLWLATPDRGLAAALYAPCAVDARVGPDTGTPVTITERTDYPFDDVLTFEVSPATPVRFPLYLRLPAWCREPRVAINDREQPCGAFTGNWLRLERTWRAGDVVRLTLPMRVRVRQWEHQQQSVSIDRGPLTFALRIDTEYRRREGTDEWPGWDLLPKSAWNYGLVLDDAGQPAGLNVVSRPGPLPDQPFDAENAPLALQVQARRVPEWTLDDRGLAHELQPSPALTSAPVETVTLIPMGAARLRISAFPTVTTGLAGHEWSAEPPSLPATSSHCYSGDTEAAMGDGRLPANSDDHSLPRFTWWSQRGSREWVQYRFEEPKAFDGVSVYWFDDRPRGGGCRVPASWRVLYRAGDEWLPVQTDGDYGLARDRFNTVTFAPVTTDALRLDVQLQEGFSGGILEWQVMEVRPPTARASDYPVRPVPFTAVHLEDAFWRPRLETNRTVTLPFAFRQCEQTGRIDNFARAGGLQEGPHQGRRYNDSDVFKIMEGAAYTLSLASDPDLDAYLDGLIAKSAAAQEDDGYLYTIRTLLDGPAPKSVGDERWSYLAQSHELYNVGHLYEAAVAHFRATGKRNLLDVALKSADLIDQVFGPHGRHDVPGHQEIEIGLAKLYRLTGEPRHLALAKFFLDERGYAHNRELYGSYAQDHLPVLQQAHPVGHSVRATYLYCGMADVAALTGDAGYVAAIDRIWQNMVACRMYLTGGIGARHGGEAFGEDYELPNVEAYAETCAAVGNVLWNERMFCLHGQTAPLDVLERALYNGLVSGVARSGDRFFYTNPLASTGAFERRPWYDCACCPSNLARFLPSLPGYVYATRDAELFVNLYIAGQAEFELAGQPLRVTQQTNYPWAGRVELTLTPAAPTPFTLALRIPSWARGRPVPSDLYRYLDATPADVTLRVNGKEEPLVLRDGFAVIERTWSPGDTVMLELAMPIRRVVAHDKVASCAGCVALERGPLVYCFEAVDNDDAVHNLVLPDDATVSARREPGLLGGVTVLQATGRRVGADGESAPAPLTAVPYHLWNHRGKGEMTVWLPRTAGARNPAAPPPDEQADS